MSYYWDFVRYNHTLDYYSLNNPLFRLHSEITVIDPNIREVYKGGGEDLKGLRILLLQLIGYMKSIYNFTFTSSSCLFYTMKKLNL